MSEPHDPFETFGTSWYVVFSWLGDVIRGERINVGVMAVRDDRYLFRWLSDWTRARAFDPHIPPPEWWADWARGFEGRSREYVRTRRESTAFAMSCASYSEPRGSIVDTADSLLEHMAEHFLVQPAELTAPAE